MASLDVAGLHAALGEGRVEWRKHVLQRLAERGIRQPLDYFEPDYKTRKP